MPMKCDYCGNNPVPHQMLKGNELMSIMMEPLDRLTRALRLHKLFDPLIERLSVPFIDGLAKAKLVRLSEDIELAKTVRSKVIWQEAQRRGIPMRQLFVFGKPTDFYRAEYNAKRFYFESLPIPSFLNTEANQWLDNKVILKEKLLTAGLPAARGGGFTKWPDMLRIFKMLRKPVIIKPATGSRGRHTTTYIYTEQQLKQAFKAAKQIAERLVMEEHLIGSVYRATIINGKLVGVLRGDPPRITGDGAHTIAQLAELKNQHRPEQVKAVEITPYIENFLARNGYYPDTVLPKGRTIDLLEKIGIGYGGYKAEEIEITHPETKKILEEAGRLVNFPVMGFDFITPDIRKHPDEQYWGIIECNSLPFIDLHHFPLEGKPVNVASYVWDLWKQS
jgi:cyanophycin synthetase